MLKTITRRKSLRSLITDDKQPFAITFFKYSKEAREGVKIVTMDMSGNYIPLIILLRSPVSRLRLKQSIPRLFHSQILKLFLTVSHVQHMNRALKQTRIQIMKQFEKKSLEYRVLKYYWKLIQKDRRKLSPNAFYSRTFRETLTPKECLDKIFKHVPQLEKYYTLYQLLLFHSQEKISNNFLD